MSIEESGECFECGEEVDIVTVSTDPVGRPLCTNCFSVLVRAGKQQDVDELI